MLQTWGRTRVMVAVAALCCAGRASAFSYESPVGAGCHERISADALRAVRSRYGLPALPVSHQERLVIDDLPFRVPADMRDLAGAALLVGVRDPDLRGHSGIDSFGLAPIHGDPDGQREHCLRRAEDDGSGGSDAALADCRAHILGLVGRALDEGLGADGLPDADRRTVIPVYLEMRAETKASLPLFYVYLGEALHALQDSYTHTYRSPRDGRVRVVLNWVEYSSNSIEARRDGPAHARSLDTCDDAVSGSLQRRGWATDASIRLLDAVANPARDVAQRKAAAAVVLDAALELEPGCNLTNRWCDAPEELFAPAAGCQALPGSAAALALLTLALLLVRRRASRGALLGAALVVSLAGPARAAEPGEVAGAPACAPGRQLLCACADGESGAQACRADGSGFEPCACRPGARTASTSAVTAATPARLFRFSVHAAMGLSIDRTALAGSVGVRYAFSERWMVGLSAEWNPWWSLETQRFRSGAVNVYASVMHRVPITAWASLRTTAHLGVSALTFELAGAPAWSVGPHVAVSLLGVEFLVTDRLRVVVDPCEIALPVPHVTGAPLMYRQYRLAVGVQLGV